MIAHNFFSQTFYIRVPNSIIQSYQLLLYKTTLKHFKKLTHNVHTGKRGTLLYGSRNALCPQFSTFPPFIGILKALLSSIVAIALQNNSLIFQSCFCKQVFVHIHLNSLTKGYYLMVYPNIQVVSIWINPH